MQVVDGLFSGRTRIHLSNILTVLISSGSTLPFYH